MASLHLKSYGEYVQELRYALELECSRKEASTYGTLREWKSIDGKIRKTERNFARFLRSNKNLAKTKGDFKEIVKCLSVPFLLLLVKSAVDIAIAFLAAFAVSRFSGKTIFFFDCDCILVCCQSAAFLSEKKKVLMCKNS